IVKLDSSGDLDTSFGGGGTRTVGGTSADYAYSIVEASDGGFVVAGYTNSYGEGNYDMYIVKLTSGGALDTSFGDGGTRTVGGTGSDRAYSIVQTSDGGYVAAGSTESSFAEGDFDMYMAKLTSSGDLDTSFGDGGTRTIGDLNDDRAHSVLEASDGGIVVAGYTGINGPKNHAFSVVKLDSSGGGLSFCGTPKFGSGGVLGEGGGEVDSGGEDSSGGEVNGGGYVMSYSSTFFDMQCKAFKSDPKVPEDEDDEDEEELTEHIKKTAQYKHYREKYKNSTARRIYEKIKHLKKGDKGEYAYYLHLKANYTKYKHLSKRERKAILTQQEYDDFEVYRKYKGYKKYKELRKKTVWL
ncbi:MAG: delta-60 repeat domain-containing protein, partial [Patescibacteria group bacterium]